LYLLILQTPTFYNEYIERNEILRKNMEAVMEKSLKLRVQKFGKFLSGMVMPNIAAFVAWGLITAFVIPTGWTPNATLAELVGPMILNLLPLLIGYTGGKMIHGVRGGVIGAIATMGVVVGADIPMFMGAMIMGPLGGYLIKLIDDYLDGKVKAGFEMLVANYTAGILGVLIAIFGLLVINPVVVSVSDFLGNGVDLIVSAKLLPIASILIEPAKILFLNNAINHGVLSPLGIAQAESAGRSILFLLETNPGPGLGILVAYWIFGKGMAKDSASSAVIIHFFGGIHEIYFPYVLMKPILILAVIAGGASGVLVFQIFDTGLIAPPSPGSIFALMTMTPKGQFFPVILGVLVSSVVSFFVASIFLKADKRTEEEMMSFEEAVEKKDALKNKKAQVEKIAFACDAGMGSSAMGATSLRSKFKKAGISIEVVHCSIDEIPTDVQLVVTHKDLANRVRAHAAGVEIVTITNFVGAPEYDQLVSRLK
jgi:PTS system mannitol-specific IIC component